MESEFKSLGKSTNIKNQKNDENNKKYRITPSWEKQTKRHKIEKSQASTVS